MNYMKASTKVPIHGIHVFLVNQKLLMNAAAAMPGGSGKGRRAAP